MGELNSKAYHSGKAEADNSATPWWILRQVCDVANVIVSCDMAATAKTAKADCFFTKEDDALLHSWANAYFENQLFANNVLYINPPFSMAREFTEKAVKSNVPVLGCVKYAPDTAWFQDNVEDGANYIYVPDGRINFVDENGELLHRIKDGKKIYGGANFPVCFPLWLPYNNGGEAQRVRFKRDKQKYQTPEESKLERQK